MTSQTSKVVFVDLIYFVLLRPRYSTHLNGQTDNKQTNKGETEEGEGKGALLSVVVIYFTFIRSLFNVRSGTFLLSAYAGGMEQGIQIDTPTLPHTYSAHYTKKFLLFVHVWERC